LLSQPRGPKLVVEREREMASFFLATVTGVRKKETFVFESLK
jgi:hypothetical protein